MGALLAGALSVRAASGGAPDDRVVFAPPGLALPGTELGRSQRGLWAAVPDVALRGDLLREVRLLYFSRDEYERAMRGLSAAQIATSIDVRVRRWSPRVLETGTEHLYFVERDALALSAVARRRSRSAGDAHFEASLRLLADLVGRGREDDRPVPDLLVDLVEGEAHLLRERTTLPEGGAPAQPEAVVRARLRTLGVALERLGRPEYVGSVPYAEQLRAVFVAPRDASFVATLEAQKTPVFEFRDGLVTEWPAERLGELTGRGWHAVVVYLNAGEWLQDAGDLAPAQLERELADRLSAPPGASRTAAAVHLRSVELEQHLLRRNALAVAQRQAPWLVPELQRETAEEAAAIRDALARGPSWLERVPDAGHALDAVAAADRRFLRDCALLEALAQRSASAELAARYHSLREIEEKQVGAARAPSASRP
jgi:hypothetical protein